MTGIGERLEREWQAGVDEVRRMTGHRTSAAPATAAVTINPDTQEEPVSLSADLHAIAARLETLGEDAVEVVTRVKGNPETAKVFAVLDELTGLNISPGLIDLVGSGLSELAARARAAAQQPEQPSFVPAGPQVGGQA